MEEKTVYAKMKNFDQPPRKVRLVADAVRGLMVEDAIIKLKFIDKKCASGILKVLDSATANATNNSGMGKAKLYISEIRVNEGIKRKKPFYRGRGGVDMIQKRYSHILIGLKEKELVK